MITVVWFSHPPDYGKLSKSVAAVHALDPDALTVVVVENGHAAPDVPGVCIVRSDFNRGSHLNGNSAVVGVAQTLGLFRLSDLVVKLDSDMVPREAFWLDGAVAFQRPNRSFFGGYCLTGDQAGAVADSVMTDPPTIGHEAIEICRRADAFGGLRVVAINEYTPESVFLIASKLRLDYNQIRP